jgi:hypothetical protein
MIGYIATVRLGSCHVPCCRSLHSYPLFVYSHVFICARIVVAARGERDHCRARTAALLELQWNSMLRCFTSLTCVTTALELFAMKHVGDSKQRVLFSSFFHFYIIGEEKANNKDNDTSSCTK